MCVLLMHNIANCTPRIINFARWFLILEWINLLSNLKVRILSRVPHQGFFDILFLNQVKSNFKMSVYGISNYSETETTQ